jgi:hypothetical protein
LVLKPFNLMAKHIVVTKDGVPTHLYSVLKKALLERGLKPRSYLNPKFPIDLPTGEKLWQLERL